MKLLMSMTAELPDDVIIEILKLLPVKSLVRFTSVCKKWLNLLQSPSFIAMHLSYTKSSKPSILLHRIILKHQFCVFSFHSNDTSLTKFSQNLEVPLDDLLGIHNGIVLVEDPWELVMCNPATKEVKQLQLPPKISAYQNFVIGFGSSSNVLDLKIVRIFESAASDKNTSSIWTRLRAHLFTLSSNRWTLLDWCLDRVNIFPGKYFNMFLENSCHWYVGRERHHLFQEAPEPAVGSILCFDMNTNCFRRMGISKDCLESLDQKRFGIGVVKEFMSLISWKFEKEGMVDIWIMKEYGVAESWTKLYELGPFSRFKCPLSFWMNDDALLLEDARGRLVTCELKTKQTEHALVFYGAIIGGSGSGVQVGFYNESLVSVGTDFPSYKNILRRLLT